jgi:hypothetical protein
MQAGLHSPEEFKDNCGFGLIAHMQGQPSHELLETAIESLTCMTHRGGIAADGKTGDGCGILMKKPDSFLRQVAKDLWGVNLAPQFAIGVVFLPVDTKKSESTKAVVEAELLNVGLGVTFGGLCQWIAPYVDLLRLKACQVSSIYLLRQTVSLRQMLPRRYMLPVKKQKLHWLAKKISTWPLYQLKLSLIKAW